MDDKISRRLNQIEEAKKTGMNMIRKYATPKKIFSIIEMLASVILIIGVNIITARFDISKLTELWFWVRTAATTLGIFMLFRAVVNSRFDATAHRDVVVDARDDYQKHNRGKGLDFKDFIKMFNLRTKIETYVSIINSKILKLELRLYKLTRKNIKLEKKNAKIAKIEGRIDDYKHQITTDYINEHIDSIHVKYYMVYVTDFNSEDTFASSGIMTRDTYNQTFNLASLKNMATYIVSATFLGIGIFDPNASSVDIAVSILGALVMIATRIATALMEAERIYDSTITKSLIDRTTILKEYYEWRSKNQEGLESSIMPKEEPIIPPTE